MLKKLMIVTVISLAALVALFQPDGYDTGYFDSDVKYDDYTYSGTFDYSDSYVEYPDKGGGDAVVRRP